MSINFLQLNTCLPNPIMCVLPDYSESEPKSKKDREQGLTAIISKPVLLLPLHFHPFLLSKKKHHINQALTYFHPLPPNLGGFVSILLSHLYHLWLL